MIGIYKITNPSSKVYIGQSINIDNRFRQYKKESCKGQIRLHNSFCKYGVDSHIFEILEECKLEELNERERHWQEYYDSIEKGLNCRYTKTNDKSGSPSAETILRLKLAIQGRKRSQEVVKRVADKNRGKKRSKEFVEARSGGLNSYASKVFATDIETGSTIEFGSMSEAVKYTGLSIYKIRTRCTDSTKTAGGYTWRYS